MSMKTRRFIVAAVVERLSTMTPRLHPLVGIREDGKSLYLWVALRTA